MTTKTTISSGDRRPGYVKSFDKKLKGTHFPNCYGHCPDKDSNCPPLEEFTRYIKEHKNISFNMLPPKWECRLCIYGEYL